MLGAHSWATLYNSDDPSKNSDNASPRSQNPFQPFTLYKNVKRKKVSLAI